MTRKNQNFYKKNRLLLPTGTGFLKNKTISVIILPTH
nr:MAG TPA: hypothetical protein [Caudoviricetes sp.]DAU62073.1 MAG TPA: hypothetical protein [Caudoviricetes sp.]DAV82199.1 MAG TPA: hypothetical protein [Caudoviricetes sp.]DAZ35811.1 MAG TPA: hypothetical protein [Caudoviricetes sp.]DAZ38628.1 MAG TPA: hypothetical protein [Caudoviricetes sp.]